MKCHYCGQESLREEQTCFKCGLSLGVKYRLEEIDFVFDEELNQDVNHENQGEKLTPETKNMHKRRAWIPIITGSAILIGMFIAMLSFIKPSEQGKDNSYASVTAKSLTTYISNLNDINSISSFSSDGEVVSIIESEHVLSRSSSISQEVIAIVDSNYDLYVVSGEVFRTIDNNVVSALVSQDGSGVAYIKNETLGSTEFNSTGLNEEASTNAVINDDKDLSLKGYLETNPTEIEVYVKKQLYYFDLKTNTSTKIASGVNSNYYVLSPDGNSIAYCMEGENDLQPELYVKIDQKDPKKLTIGHIPMGISNHGTYLYAMGEEEFYVIAGEKKIKLGRGMKLDEIQPNLYPQERDAIFNLDYTQVLFNDGGKSYLSEEGKITKIADSIIYGFVLPPDAGYYWRNSGTSSLVNQVVQKEDGLFYLNDNYELVLLTKNIDIRQIAADRESLLVLEDHSLFLIKDFNNKSISKTKLVDTQHVIDFMANPDLSIVYYRNDREELYNYKIGGKPIMIAEDVYCCTYNHLDGYWYYVMDVNSNHEGYLYYSTNQGTGLRVNNLERGYMGSTLGGIDWTNRTDGLYSDTYILIQGEGKKVLSRVSPIEYK